MYPYRKITLSSYDTLFIDSFDFEAKTKKLIQVCINPEARRILPSSLYSVIIFPIILVLAVIFGESIAEEKIFNIAGIIIISFMLYYLAHWFVRDKKYVRDFGDDNPRYYGYVSSTRTRKRIHKNGSGRRSLVYDNYIAIRFKSNSYWYEAGMYMQDYQPFKVGDLIQFCYDIDKHKFYPCYRTKIECKSFDQTIYGLKKVEG